MKFLWRRRSALAIMSTKGQSVVAARRLVDELCQLGQSGVPLLILHDLDKEGLLISQTLTSVSWAAEEANRVRYEFRHTINLVDLGLRLQDVQEWDLESESVRFRGSFDIDTIATPEEQEFLRGNKRVELNAFTSADFIAWLESKLKAAGIKKVVPDDDTLAAAYRRACRISIMNQRLREVEEEAKEQAGSIKIPRTLARQIRKKLKEDPAGAWDDVVAELAGEALDLDDGESAC